MRLWQVLLEEWRKLRKDDPDLERFAASPAHPEPAKTPEKPETLEEHDARKLRELFEIVHSWQWPQAGRGHAQAAGDPQDPGPRGPLAALCFSGGGIRSATFNLGVLQGFARLGLLEKFDYLSSVSGGGYIASWLAHWVREAPGGIREVSSKLREPTGDPTHPEPAPLTHLRRYSNYLTPRLGALSADSWTAVSIVVRNLILNWVVLLPLLAAPLLVPLLAVAKWPYPQSPRRVLFIAAFFELFGLFFMSRLRISRAGSKADARNSSRQLRYLALGLLPRLVALIPLLASVSCFVAMLSAISPRQLYGYCGFWALGLPFLALVLTTPSLLRGGRTWQAIAWDAVSVIAAGGIDTWIYVVLVRTWLFKLVGSPYPLYVILGPSVILGTMLLGRTVLVAVSSVSEHMFSRDFGEEDREWWARWSGWTLIVLVVWMLLSALVLFAPTILSTLRAEIAALFSAGGFGTLVAMLGKSGATPANKEKGETSPVKRLVFALGAPIFVVAFVLWLSWGGQRLIETVWPNGDLNRAMAQATASAPEAGWVYVAPYSGLPRNELIAICALVLFGWLAGYPVNINRFSMQGAYRNRLIRAYPGASNFKRDPNPFTGFDPKDNVLLDQLRDNRPLPVINMSLNLVDGDDLAWQQRKAECFTATPFHCGAARLGYRPSGIYGGKGGLSLGTAIATSGAAANPNMGLYTTSAFITFIMALFNVRLGIWLGNPKHVAKHPTWRLSGPRFSAQELIFEAFGLTNDDHPYVSLSDGGHFEDLGLYEMVRRRCRFIVVSDAGADPTYAFDDLGNAIRKIRIDFGIPITFTGVHILPKDDSGKPAKGGRYCAVGTIDYGVVDGPGASRGTLIYFKPAICDDSPFDVENYARESKAFPHETTADQWFNETQFESYRALGEAAVQAKKSSEGSAGLWDLGDEGDEDDAENGDHSPVPADFPEYLKRIQSYLETAKARGEAVSVGAAGREGRGGPEGQGAVGGEKAGKAENAENAEKAAKAAKREKDNRRDRPA